MVIALLALLAGVVGVRLTAGSDRATLRQDAATLMVALTESRVRAARTGRIVTLDRSEIAAGLSPGTRLSGPVRLRFFPEGGAEAATIGLSRSEIGYRLRIDAFTGAVALEETAR